MPKNNDTDETGAPLGNTEGDASDTQDVVSDQIATDPQALLAEIKTYRDEIKMLRGEIYGKVDRAENVLGQRLDATLKAIDEQGSRMGIPPAEREEAKRLARIEAAREAGNTLAVQNVQPQSQTYPPQTNPIFEYVKNRRADIVDKYGAVNERDPEFKLIDDSNPDYNVYLSTYESSAKQKAARLAKGKTKKEDETAEEEDTNPAPKGAPEARLTSPGRTGQPPGRPDLRATYDKEMETAMKMGYSSEQKANIRKKYIERGLLL